MNRTTRKWIVFLLAACLMTGVTARGPENTLAEESRVETAAAETVAEETAAGETAAEETAGTEAAAEISEETTGTALPATTEEERTEIETALNLANNPDQEWTYSAESDAWTLSVVTAVTNPEIEDEQGVSVCVPGAYVKGIDTDGDGEADVTAESYSESVKGSLIIDEEAQVTSTNGQLYTAATAPIILNTGAAGYSEQQNQTASASYATEGYINVACGNRGKQSSITDGNGDTVYTGDAPSCLVDQKNAIRFVKYNILLGNLPGDVDKVISTGGSGGGAHASMFAATSNNPDFYDYEIEAGAVGVYRNEDGSYDTTVTIDGEETELSDGAWGCIAYSAITSLAEADMAMAFEYTLDADYTFNTAFQKQLASYLSQEYMEYINEQNLTVEEAAVGFDLNGDGDQEDNIALTIEYDEEAYPETNGYHGTYLDLYLAEFTENLQSYIDNLDYAEDWTWFDAEGNALSDEEVAAMSSQDKAAAFLEGRYTKSSSGRGGMGGHGGMGGPGGDFGGQRPDGMKGGPGGDFGGEMPEGMEENMTGEMPENTDETMTGEMPENTDETMAGEMPENTDETMTGEMPEDMGELPDGAEVGTQEEVGTPDAGTTQSATSKTDSSNYATYAEMVEAYEADIAEISAGDEYGKNIVSLYNPLNYIGAEGTENPVWTRILCGASEGDISMFNSLNLQLAWLNAGTDAVIEWQWDGGHVPSEILGDSFALYVDEMVGKYVEGAAEVTKPEAEAQTENGTSEEASGTDLTGWVDMDEEGQVSFALADAAAYRTSGASKATPGFDVMDYGQEDYVFGSAEKDARHWNAVLLKIFKEHADILETLFNAE